MISQSEHSCLSLASNSGRSWDSYRAVFVSGSSRAIFLPPPLLLLLPPEVLELSLLSSPHAAAPSASVAAAATASHLVVRMGWCLLLVECWGTVNLGSGVTRARLAGPRGASRTSRRRAARARRRR